MTEDRGVVKTDSMADQGRANMEGASVKVDQERAATCDLGYPQPSTNQQC